MKVLEKTITSLEVAEMVDREHSKVIRDIRTVISHLGAEAKNGLSEYFTESTYKDKTGRTLPSFLLTKKGCELYATRMTGEKGTQFAVKYIERFNEMENHIKQNELDMKQLSPELQIMNNMVRALAHQELEQKRMRQELNDTRKEISDVRQVFVLNPKNWRKEVNDLIVKISKTKNSLDAYRETRNESYKRLEERARCNLSIRLDNKRERMKKAGSSKTAIERANKMDVIAEDDRLKEIYVTVVKEMAIQHKVAI